MAITNSQANYIAAAVLGFIGLLLSPLGLMVINSPPGLSVRDIALTIPLDLFLLAVIGGIISRGRRRQLCFHLVAWTIPLTSLAGLEGLARVFHLADRVAPLIELSVLERRSWPEHLLSNERWKSATDASQLYVPWAGDGIYINELGLRTAPPRLKAPGEWRVALSGGSAVWGWRVSDADTIPSILQRLLRASSGKTTTVFNFGIEGATLKSELNTLRRFQKLYDIDEIVFYTGSNDVLASYSGLSGGFDRIAGLLMGSSEFELIRATRRLLMVSGGEDERIGKELTREKFPALLRDSSLTQGVLAADEYCQSIHIECRFVLQPNLFTRTTLVSPETKIINMWQAALPGFATLTKAMYHDAVSARPDRTYELSHVFDAEPNPLFIDNVHVNETGNRLVAVALASTLFAGQARQ